MTVRFFALIVAGLAAACQAAETPFAHFAIYYSFEQAPSASLLATLQDEFARVATPAGVQVEWLAAASRAPVDFAEIFTVRFDGSCTMDVGDKHEPALTSGETSLAASSISDGRVIPFAQVHCNLLRRYLGSGAAARTDAVLARAMGRVTAHEVYHMLTGSASHCGHGIAQAEYSPDDLTSERFAFGKNEVEWMRSISAAYSRRQSL